MRHGGSNGKLRGEFVKKAGKGFRKGRQRSGTVDIKGYFELWKLQS